MGALTLVKWGTGLHDIRNFNKANFIADCEDPKTTMGYGNAPMKQKEAEKLLAETLENAPPGVLFSSNPHYGIYAKWDNLLIKAGFKMASPMCAINRVYNKTWDWKGKSVAGVSPNRAKYESPDGYSHWIHAMYLVKPPVPELKFDFEHFDGSNGDTDGMKMWAVGYGGRNKPAKPASGYGYSYEKSFARLAHNCGCAMGEGLPEFGKFVDEEFYTIVALPEDKLMPTGYSRFLRVGGMKFGTNLKKLLDDTAQVCPHKFDVLG